MTTAQSLNDGCLWNAAAAEGTFDLADDGTSVECIVPPQTLIDRFPGSCGHGGRLVIRGIDFLGRM